MKEPSIQQLFLIESLLGSFGNRISLKRISELVNNDSRKASAAITRLKVLDSKEAERINKLPLNKRIYERKSITKDQFELVFK